ncbi:MAG: type I-E CRISPR-associated protein Cse1/CasA [Patescibacteria group bacterium]|nr:type I-E CRISPR-associated protein Cse1/CasA [Patescibacteria group bacterium]
MSRFNLVDEKWIPVRLPDGSREELGIRDILLRAEEIAAIEDPSPLVVVALHRFLLAVLYRALEGPTDIDQAKELFTTGLPADRINAYLDKWHGRLWLFDDKYPCGQNINVPPDEIEPWTKLTPEANATTNKVLFDHTDTRNAGSREPAQCARWLVATMAFSISGGRGYYPSPSPNAMMCIPLGHNLRETLCFCLVPYRNREVVRGDSAVWEREPKRLPLENPKRVAAGFADLYTWQPRMVLLEELPDGSVAAMRFVAGEGFENPSQAPDPMQPFRKDKLKGTLPIQFRGDRGTWRDFDSLIPDVEALAPQTIENAIRLAGGKPNRLPSSVLVAGLRYDPPNANLDFWRMERFTLPSTLVGDKHLRSGIRGLLDAAEDSQQSLWRACKSYARDLLSRGDRVPEGKDIGGFIAQMPAIPRYWSTLEAQFHEILQVFTPEADLEELKLRWFEEVRAALRDAWEQHRSSVSMGDAWAIRALVKADGLIAAKVRELDNTIAEYKRCLGKENS